MRAPAPRSRLALLMLLVLAMLAGACTGGVKLPKFGGNDDTATKRLISSSGAFEMNVPESWQQTGNLNDVAVLQAANRSDEAYALLIADPKAPFEGMALAAFAENQIKQFEASLTDPKLTGPETATVDGNKAVQYRIDGKADDVEVIYLYTFIETPDNFLKVLTWSLTDKFDDNEDTLSTVTSSVRQVMATSPSAEPDPGSSESTAPSPQTSPAA